MRKMSLKATKPLTFEEACNKYIECHYALTFTDHNVHYKPSVDPTQSLRFYSFQHQSLTISKIIKLDIVIAMFGLDFFDIL